MDGQLKANDKMILKASLSEFAMEDTSETTLYSKVRPVIGVISSAAVRLL